MSADLTALARKVRDAIPLTRHLAFEYLHFDGDTLTLQAPLEPNHNDKNTFFAGSQAALVTLAGWSLTTLLAEHHGHPSDVVAVDSQLRYTRPLTGALRLHARLDDDTALARFRDGLQRKGRARLAVTVTGHDPDQHTVCEYQGQFLARLYTAG
ncbi:YiiD C-terminal domain-containing protein [Alloalcanivorax mobilis]|uniref:YiiD C-terminal domain-containing protein n=1 Tax=Alloalcanivorax mobilis TaxID=2019569 RepID=UPI000C784417|nr:YiiD C-terminal domain-containing protein [Alloalcanivorax mobilis]